MKKILGIKLPTLRLFVLIFCVANQSAPDKPNIILHGKKLLAMCSVLYMYNVYTSFNIVF